MMKHVLSVNRSDFIVDVVLSVITTHTRIVASSITRTAESVCLPLYYDGQFLSYAHRVKPLVKTYNLPTSQSKHSYLPHNKHIIRIAVRTASLRLETLP